jgi:hypothetical protein
LAVDRCQGCDASLVEPGEEPGEFVEPTDATAQVQRGAVSPRKLAGVEAGIAVLNQRASVSGFWLYFGPITKLAPEPELVSDDKRVK